MRTDISPGGTFPDYELPDHTNTPRKLSELRAVSARSAPTGTSARPGCATPGTRAISPPSMVGTSGPPKARASPDPE